MRRTLLNAVSALMGIAVIVEMSAQGANTFLRITAESSNSVRLDWNSQPGTEYQVLSTPAIDPFSLWTPASSPITAIGTNTSVAGPSTNAYAFFKLHTLGQPTSGLPTARIISHTNGETVSGLMRVVVGAEDDSRLSSVALLIDGQEYETPITAGDLFWFVNTGHFSNGPHTLTVRVLDNVGSGALGGNPDSNLAANEAFSTPVMLNFSNAVRWIEPVNGFETFVPISIRSDVFPTDWNVYVEDESGAIVRSFGGFTSDGVIETEWDGNDDIGQPVPSRAAYRVLFTLGALQPRGKTVPSTAGNSQPATFGPSSVATNDVLVWREAPWSSGQIILARQRFRGLLTSQTLNAVYANNLATLNTDIEIASLEDDRLNGRTVYSSSVFVADVASDFDVLLNDLKQSVVTDFYYIGHSNGDGIGYSEGSKNNGITSERLSLALENFWQLNSSRWGGRRLLIFNTPFRFVFIDGCLSAKGSFKAAFGIVADNDHTRLGKKRRAYLGWGATTQDSIINNNQSQWSARFWKEWVNVDNSDYDVWLQNAIANATTARPIPENPIITGYRRLTWAE